MTYWISAPKLKHTELLLIQLLRRFKFSPPEERIIWNTSRVVFPSTTADTEASMPLKVTPVGEEC